MATGRIKLGVKELSRKSLSSGQLGSFFYWRWRSSLTEGENPYPIVVLACELYTTRCSDSLTCPQHLILQTIWIHFCLRVHAGGTWIALESRSVLTHVNRLSILQRAVAQWPKAPEMSGNRGRSVGTQLTAIDEGCGGSNPTCSNFYDNPSQKRGIL